MIIEFEISKWYLANKRELPWRNTKNPYEIWVSEVILQQTRVDQALDYYYNFLGEFPDIETLANADQQHVLKVWQGLGYYSRARNMHFSAKYIVNELNGIFPKSYSELIKLKGIGDYTAAAIASFAYNERVPAVDGNVYRVLSRIFAEDSPINSDKGKKIFKKLAFELLKTEEPGIFNQAMMEFGALQCVPKNPNCGNCPIKNACEANLQNRINDFPVKNKLSKKKNRYFNYIYLIDNEYTFIRERNKKDIWNGLFEFPLIETSCNTDFAQICMSADWKDIFNNVQINLNSVSNRIIHLLTHQKIHIVFYTINAYIPDSSDLHINGFIKIRIEDLIKYPVSKVIENFIRIN